MRTKKIFLNMLCLKLFSILKGEDKLFGDIADLIILYSSALIKLFFCKFSKIYKQVV